jgi:hypothetical protein
VKLNPTSFLQLSVLDLAVAKGGTIPRADLELRQGQNGTTPATTTPTCLASVRPEDGPVQLARMAVQGVIAANRSAPQQLMGAFERFKDLAVMDAEAFTKDFVRGGQVSLDGCCLLEGNGRHGLRFRTVGSPFTPEVSEISSAIVGLGVQLHMSTLKGEGKVEVSDVGH